MRGPEKKKNVHERYCGCVTRTIAYVGNKLGWGKGFGVDIRLYDICRFESLWGA